MQSLGAGSSDGFLVPSSLGPGATANLVPHRQHLFAQPPPDSLYLLAKRREQWRKLFPCCREEEKLRSEKWGPPRLLLLVNRVSRLGGELLALAPFQGSRLEERSPQPREDFDDKSFLALPENIYYQKVMRD